jgi:hypothetical protein
MAGCRILTEDDGILRAMIDGANAATIEAFHLIYAEQPKSAARSRTPKSKKPASPESEAVKRATRTPRKAPPAE